MQKIIFITVFCLLFIGCASTGGTVQADIINGAANTDTAISDLQGQQSDSAGNAEAINGTSQQIADTGNDLAESIKKAVDQLASGAITDKEFAEIIQRIQNRQPVNYLEPVGTDKQPSATDTETKSNP